MRYYINRKVNCPCKCQPNKADISDEVTGTRTVVPAFKPVTKLVIKRNKTIYELTGNTTCSSSNSVIIPAVTQEPTSACSSTNSCHGTCTCFLNSYSVVPECEDAIVRINLAIGCLPYLVQYTLDKSTKL